MRTAAFSFLLSLVVAAVLTPRVRDLALRRGWLDLAMEARKVHGRPVPRLGGIAIVLAFYLPLLGLLLYPTSLGVRFYQEPLRAAALLVGAACVALLGLYDDLQGAGALLKLSVQLSVALGLWICGLRVEHLGLPGLGTFALGALSLPMTLLWVVGVINAMNLIDGLDGLAGGVAFFALATSFLVAFVRGEATMALLSAALAGSVLGFLVYNFNPASIFMGDTGSMFLGFVLAAGSIQTHQKASTAVALLVPLVTLGVPIADTALAIGRRALAGRPIFSADREHIHHRLLALGFSQRQAVLVLWAASLLLGLGALALSFANSRQTAATLSALALFSALAVRRLYFAAGEPRPAAGRPPGPVAITPHPLAPLPPPGPGRPPVHRVRWSPERVQGFWDNFSSTPGLDEHYFSRNHGLGILETIDRFSPLGGAVVLDYGCGSGHFLDLLLGRGHLAMGCDSSPHSLAAAQARLEGRPGFLGVFAAGGPPPRRAEVITLLEVVEHLPAEELPGFLRGVAALLAPGGRVLTTSPHREDLAAHEVLCPECGALFHPSQHQASIDAQAMEAAARGAGLSLVRAQPTLFRRNADASLRTFLRQRAVERLWPRSAPHLLCELHQA